MGDNGVYKDDTPLFAGQHVFKANEPIVDKLREVGNLMHEKLQPLVPALLALKHRLFSATPQWFISMDKKGLRAGALDQIKKVGWFPEWDKAIESMVEGRPDWCISRHTWGNPIAVFVNRETDELHPNTLDYGKVAQLIEKEGVQAWFDLEPETLLGDEADHTVKLLTRWTFGSTQASRTTAYL